MARTSELRLSESITEQKIEMGWLTDFFIGLFERLTYNEIFRFLGDTKLPQNEPAFKSKNF